MSETVSINEIEKRVSDLSPIKRTLLGLRLEKLEANRSVRKSAPAAKRLVAYVVSNEGELPPASQLRGYLSGKLPDYMVPSAYVYMDELPVTSGGKVDRRALPAPSQILADMEADFVAPRDPVEEVLCGIWAEVLGLERVSIYGDFFELGGHSLTAAQVIYKIRDIFQTEIPIRSLFEATTVEELAEVLVAAEPNPGRARKIAEVYRRIKSMSPEEMKEELLKRKRK